MSFVMLNPSVMPIKPLSSSSWDEAERQAILDVVDSGRLTMGEKVQQFEEAYAAYIGTKYCVAVNSGSSANLLMVAARTLRRGAGKVIVPAVGWSTSYSPFQQYGWILIFVDVDPDTLGYDRKALNRAIEEYSPDLILGINLLGNSEEYAAITSRIPIIEDNCEAMGAEYAGRKTGTFGEMASHSTYFSHHICTIEGGMITTNDEVYRDMLISLRSHGWTRHLSEQNALNEKVAPFRFIYPGYNVRPTEIQAAIGLEQLKKLPAIVEARRKNALAFPLKKQMEIGKSSWFGFVVCGEDRKRCARLESRPVISGNFLRQPAIFFYQYYVAGPLPGADYLHDEAIMVGNSHEIINWGDYIE